MRAYGVDEPLSPGPVLVDLEVRIRACGEGREAAAASRSNGVAQAGAGVRAPVLHYEVQAEYDQRSMPTPPGLDPQVADALQVERLLAERFVCRAWYMGCGADGTWTKDAGAPLPFEAAVSSSTT